MFRCPFMGMVGQGQDRKSGRFVVGKDLYGKGGKGRQMARKGGNAGRRLHSAHHIV